MWQIELSTPEGKKRLSSRTSLKKAAILIGTYQQQAINDAINFDKSASITLREACETYVDEQSRKAEGTLANAKFNARHLLDGLIWDPMCPFESITSKQVVRLQKEKSKEGLGNNSINHITTALTTMRNRTEVWECLTPLFKVKKLKAIAKFRYLKPENLDLNQECEEKLLLAVMKSEDLKDLTIFLLDTGMRICEAVATMWSDRTHESGVECLVVYREKTDERTLLPVTPRLRGILKRREATSLSVYVFPHETIKGAHRTTSSKGIINAANRAGLNTPQVVSKLGKFTAHSCRDTYATRLIRAGMTLYAVQIMLGHASPVMTQKYAHLATSDIGQQVLNVLCKYE